MSARLLVVDEQDKMAPPVLSALQRRFKVVCVPQVEEAAGAGFDMAVIAPGAVDPSELCRRLIEVGAAAEVMILGSSPSLEDTIRAIRAQAFDFVPEGDEPQAVVNRLRQAIELIELRRELSRLQAGPVPATPFPELIGDSTALRRLKLLIERVARSEATVLITGESGTGKEIVARTLHAHGPHPGGPFLVTNLGAIPRQLLESELFGHMRGAFTGAVADRKGLLLRATGGTLFLDEVADMPLEVQAKLLRALQQRSLRALGQREEVPFNARIVAATSRDLEQEVAAGRFRQDLYFRLNVIQLVVPPLRERGHDVLLLAQHFIQRESSVLRPVVGLTPGAARALLAYRWPGNVRELEHCIVSAAACARYDHITAPDLPERVRGQEALAPERDVNDLISLRELERQHILEVLRSVGGNKALTSRRLGLDRKTLYRKLKEYGEATS
ncbi:MAG: sigma-54 dependent DNA-binding response regulator [Pseudomonadota bacterium]|jgi:two-component system, NtrC family, response regulator AtoC